MAKTPKTTIGWEEWCALPDLRLPAIRAKIDTGAKTSALHATRIEPFEKKGQSYVRFQVAPLKRNKGIKILCEAPVIDLRTITSSNGEMERRYVIETALLINGGVFKTEVTLTSRHKMTFRMLLGRGALRKGRLIVDPAKSYMLGKIKNPEDHYLIQNER